MVYSGYSQEDADYEFNSGFDYLAEAYGAEAKLLKDQARYETQLEEEAQSALDWLTEQGGLVEIARCEQDFHARAFYRLEEDGLIKRVVPDGCDRMYWSIAATTELKPVLSEPTEVCQSIAMDDSIPF